MRRSGADEARVAPRMHGAAGDEPTLHDLVPSDELPSVLREMRTDSSDEPCLQRFFVREVFAPHERLTRRAFLPSFLRRLIAADVDVLRWEQLDDFVEHVCQEFERALLSG